MQNAAHAMAEAVRIVDAGIALAPFAVRFEAMCETVAARLPTLAPTQRARANRHDLLPERMRACRKEMVAVEDSLPDFRG